ncbi:winged helix-turn-helix domain-containing protein [Haloferax sp. AB510]|uniref:winged helix-turn-helix domain-containing protein n=1 Tax=Haloferax sp. AB510 TaxID=2934172 RepID=UPI00209BE30D|nr:winged helix-turn-helix domain-containing protein [Haloferax sp. AB510]MCO8266555.1 winged helix-turn-helix domain-containing protein [Haloferax sp. AB510]
MSRDTSNDPNNVVDRTQAEDPAGWLVLTQNDSAAKIIDALIKKKVRREMNKSEIADISGVSRQSVLNHIDLLIEIGVLDKVQRTKPQRYQFNLDSDVCKAVTRLDAAMHSDGIDSVEEGMLLEPFDSRDN